MEIHAKKSSSGGNLIEFPAQDIHCIFSFFLNKQMFIESFMPVLGVPRHTRCFLASNS